MKAVIRPPKLKKNAHIRIVASASPPDLKELSEGVNILKKLGYTVSLGRNIRRLVESSYLAAPDKERAIELMEAFKDDSVDAIFCARGGYGSIRILPELDYDVIRDHPKIFVGYSDITALHLAINNLTGLITFHGPMPGADADEMKKPIFSHFLSILSGESLDMNRMINRVIKYINPGSAEGISEGTNISLVASLVGTKYMPDPNGKILFIEDSGTSASDIDRYFFRLKLANMLDKFNGFIFGDFSNIPKEEGPMPSIEEIVQQYMRELENKPSLYGLPFGHGDEQMLIPLGARIRLSTEEPYIELLENVVD